MNWFERRIRRYEHLRWTQDDNRRVQPFAWGLEQIGGNVEDPDPAAFLANYARQAIETSRDCSPPPRASNYRFAPKIFLPSPPSSPSLGPKNTPVSARPGREKKKHP